jgi:hypothetical protein
LKALPDANFVKQKLDYIHDNPVRGKWNLAKTPADCEHSSARFYKCGEHAAYTITGYFELEDMRFNKISFINDAESTVAIQ